MTHDLLKNVISNLKVRILKIVVTELRDNTYYAAIHLEQGGQQLQVDARPSDAIALALRSESPIFVNPEVLEKAHTVDMSADTADSEKLKKWFESLDLKDLGKYTM
jgi:bifunctional DNase/RNase